MVGEDETICVVGVREGGVYVRACQMGGGTMYDRLGRKGVTREVGEMKMKARERGQEHKKRWNGVNERSAVRLNMIHGDSSNTTA